MDYAIKSNGVGKIPTARHVKPGWTLEPDEVLIPEADYDGSFVLDDDGKSLRPRNSIEMLSVYAEKKKKRISDSLNDVLAAGFKCSNGITMDAFADDIQLLDAGYRGAEELATENGITDMSTVTMTIGDHYDTNPQPVLPLPAVKAMRLELYTYWNGKWQTKNNLRGQVDAIVSRNQLDPADPDYLDDTAARSAIDAVPMVQ